MSAKRPNFLFIMTDQQRWDTVGTARPEWLHTPALDRLAATGCNFRNAFCQGPICVPSRASFLTGKYVHQHRLYHNNSPLPDFETTWGDVLYAAGWQTIAVGRTHTIHKGFEHLPVPLGGSYFDFSERIYRSGWKEFPYGHDDCRTWPGDAEDYVEFRRTRAALDALTDLRDRGAPFAMFVGYCAPHNPYILPEPYASMYDDVPMPAPHSCEGDATLPDAPRLPLALDVPRMQRTYYGMVSMIDDCVGRLLAGLEERGLADDTIVIFTSDHGEMLGDHGRTAKGNIFEESIKIPFLVANAPGQVAGREADAMIESVDLFPTILDYAGVSMPEAAYRLRGRSLRPCLEGDDTPLHDAVFAELPPWIMVRTDRWKLGYGWPPDDCLTNPPHDYTGILFDLQNDPGETRNLWDDPAAAAARNACLRRLVDFHLDVKIPLHKDVTAIAFENCPTLPLCVG